MKKVIKVKLVSRGDILDGFQFGEMIWIADYVVNTTH